MRKFVDNLVDSLHNRPEGFSGRKLSAFAGVNVAIFATIRFCDGTNLPTVLTIWLLFALLCLGIITFQQIMDFKTGSTVKTSSETKVEVTNTKTENKNP